MRETEKRNETDEKRLHPRKAGVKHLSIYFIKAYGKTKRLVGEISNSLA
jgi:hypothetical protein